MFRESIGVLTLVALLGSPAPLARAATGPEHLVAHWAFDAGSGEVLRDLGPRHLDGRIVNATWCDLGTRKALRFDGADDYVEIATPAAFAIAGDITLVAWVRVEGSPFPNNDTNWYIVDCEEYRQHGYMLRVDGASGKLCYRSSQAGQDQAAFSRETLRNVEFYHVAAVRRGGEVTYFIDGNADLSFKAADPLPSPVFRISSPGQSFQGVIADVRVYDAALSGAELLGLYRAEAAGFGKDTSWFDRIECRLFQRLDRGEILVEVDARGVLPLPEGASAYAELTAADAPPQRLPLDTVLQAGRQEVTFAVGAGVRGHGEVRIVCRDGAREIVGKTGFEWPPAPYEPPAPEALQAGALPVPNPPVAFTLEADSSGGFAVRYGGKRIEAASTFSFPNGGENGLGGNGTAEPEWQPRVTPAGKEGFSAVAAGRFYRVERQVVAETGRVRVADRITNVAGEAVGILIDHRVRCAELQVSRVYIAGYPGTPPYEKRPIDTNPTVFSAGKELGVGLVALDDVLIVQGGAAFRDATATLYSHEFALDAGAECTLEWALYPNDTGDYYDFINAVRRDEGRNQVTVAGGFAITQVPGNRFGVPSRADLDLRGAMHVVAPCLSHCTDDPAVSLEGIEFTAYPREKAAVAAQMQAIHAVKPEAKLMFHVAHSLYATNTPETLFPDARVIQADGTQAVYGYTYEGGSYFSAERVAAGWRWWIFYPTLENSFGKALLASVDTMVDDMHCSGAFMDGFMWAYGGRYTYDRWDGRTADIEPRTRTIARRKGSVLLLSQPTLVAFVERLRAKGGVVVGNNTAMTRTIGRLPLIVDKEITEGPDVHLAPTPITMGNPAGIRNELDVYADVRRKLEWGNLYFYYGEGTLTYPSLPQRMYPITVQEVRAGVVVGRERVVTARSGAYGWPGNRDLHLAWRYDARGYPVPPGFLSTVDASATRTQITLGEGETAVLQRLPIQLETATPVNAYVESCDGDGLRLRLHGKGAVRLVVADGAFGGAPVTAAVAEWDGTRQQVGATGGVLNLPLTLAGPLRVTLTPVR